MASARAEGDLSEVRMLQRHFQRLTPMMPLDADASGLMVLTQDGRVWRRLSEDYAQIEQAAFEPSSLVPGIGFSPDKMLLGRVFAYADTHRARIGPNFHQLPVNRPAVERENHYSFDGPMRYEHSGAAPTYHPNSFGRPVADFEGPVDDGWEADGEIVRSAYELHAEDDDFGQAGTLVREVFDDAQRDRLVDTVVGSLAGVEDPVLSRVFEYWTNIDATIGQRIRDGKAAADESPVDPGEVLGGQETHAAQG